ncbi:MAG: hypothetical protein SVM79_08125 [Chloroflexota bacterium]|nr:hypothetical protein [Chloroflexota bacterium]
MIIYRDRVQSIRDKIQNADDLSPYIGELKSIFDAESAELAKAQVT